MAGSDIKATGGRIWTRAALQQKTAISVARTLTTLTCCASVIPYPSFPSSNVASLAFGVPALASSPDRTGPGKKQRRRKRARVVSSL
jgi:hypothetical protein